MSAIMLPGAAYAQSTGSIDSEDIVVTGARGNDGVDGHVIPDTTKAKAVLTQEAISRSAAGQTINEILNQLPGVSFQNNDPYGSAGGTMNIRGFDSSRILQTLDGFALNDTGNYAIYSNQQIDAELIEQVNVNFGSTDVDSPSASATGSTVNIRSMTPTEDFGVRVNGSAGSFSMMRVFGQINSGEITKFGTRFWVSASKQTYDWFVNDFGKVNKTQFNGKLYQPIGSNGDFISIAGHYNRNRNNFGGSIPLRTDLVQSPTNSAPRTVGTGSTNRFPLSLDELPYHVARCQVAPAVAGVADAPNSCGTSYDERYNPSITSNIRLNSKYTIAPRLTFTFDAAFQYVKANGGGTVSATEAGYTGKDGNTYYGYIGNSYYVGKDLNGDGDTRDKVTELAPSETSTHRYIFIGSLRYDLTEGQSFRIAYTHDYGRHRQTGELASLQANGVPTEVFPIDNPIYAANGFLMQKRDRLSFAILDQVSGEYNGQFGNLRVSIGVRQQWLTRKLNNFCFTTSATGFLDCLGRGNAADNDAYAAMNPYLYDPATGQVTSGYAAPQSRRLNYNRLLPSGGITYDFGGNFSVYANYSKTMQVPGTDNLYNSFYYPLSDPKAHPVPETADNFDAGVRYSSSKIQAQVGPWYTRFTNRLASAYDPESDKTIYRNLGRVDKYGIDGSIAYRPIPEISFYVFGSYLKSKIKNDVAIGNCTNTTAAGVAAIAAGLCTLDTTVYAATAGKRESGSPVYTLGGRVQGTLGPVDLGLDVKRTGRRYLNDQNLPAVGCTGTLYLSQLCVGTTYQVYGAYAPGYTMVNADVRLKLDWAGMGDKSYLQFNVLNLLDKYYVGGFSGGSTVQTTIPFAQAPYPRTFMGSINFQF